jgi:hypothetical protein
MNTQNQNVNGQQVVVDGNGTVADGQRKAEPLIRRREDAMAGQAPALSHARNDTVGADVPPHPGPP